MRSYVKGRGCRRPALPGMRRVWPAMPSDSPAVRVVVSVGPALRLMRGHIVGPARRCLSGVGRSLQAYCASRGVALAYFMAQSSVARSLGRQWPPVISRLALSPRPASEICVSSLIALCQVQTPVLRASRQGAFAAQPSIRFPWPGLCSCRADVPPDIELASSRAGMGIEFIARAVPLPGSIREVPISVKER